MNGVDVIGAGAFGTALALTLARSGHEVTLWCRTAEQASRILEAGENADKLPGIRLPANVSVTNDTADLASDAVLLAIPAQTYPDFLQAHAPRLDGRTLVSCSKGIDRTTLRRPSESLRAACPGSRVAVLTGPSFASDIAQGLPTALTLACDDAGEELQHHLSGDTLRLYLTTDVIGAELGGALKNIVALAAGLTIGAGLGESARAAVISRGFAEMCRFAEALWARPETLAGLSGLGDLVLTATSEKSRNFAAGLAMGRGQPPAEGTIEGLATAEAVSKLGKTHGIDMPLTGMVAAVTSGRMTVANAADHLMSRPLRKE